MQIFTPREYPRFDAKKAKGFALIITLTMMVLLSLMTVGLLSLSSLSLRSSSRGSAQAMARANARVSLLLAIGELQKHAGADTRITAPANILDQDYPQVTGVWRSWEGSDHEMNGRYQGRPVPPDYGSKKQSQTKGGRFLTWLVSNPRTNQQPDDFPSDIVRDNAANGFIPLLSANSLPDGDVREIHVKPIDLPSSSAALGGAMAWWISPENQKVRLPEPFKPDSDTAAQWAVLEKSHAVADPMPFELDRLLDDSSEVSKVASRRSARFLSEDETHRSADRRFHDLSTNSIGLLTNSATGGWRKDLSLVTENWNDLAKTDLPFFRITPDKAIRSSRPTPGNHRPVASMLYPWAKYRDKSSTPPIYQHGAVSSWHNLMDYATSYKRISGGGSGGYSMPFTAQSIWDPGNANQFLHQVRAIPVIARVHWVFSHRTALRGARPTGRRTHRLQLLMTPVITMWNPFNVTIDSDPVRIIVAKPLPCAFRYNDSSGFSALTAGGSYPSFSTAGIVNYEIAKRFTLAPGETRVFSPEQAEAVMIDQQPVLKLKPGYRPGSGHFFVVKDDDDKPVIIDSTSPITVDVNFDTSYSDGARGVGVYMDMHSMASNKWLLAYRMVYPTEIARKYWQQIPADELTSPTAAEVQDNPQPFLSTVFGSRVASDSHLPGKGLVQTSPLVNYTAMGKTKEYGNIAHNYSGAYHPVNSPFDYSFLKHAPGDSRLPNASDTTNRGYIISGFDKSDGLSRVVISELPTQPLASLGELQNWDMRYENPVPPYQFNIIGNSDASPLLPAGGVVNPPDAGLPSNLQHDDAYCANHILFDDWFFSSITPDPGAKDMRERFLEFVAGENPLPNHSYRPIPEDRGLSPSFFSVGGIPHKT